MLNLASETPVEWLDGAIEHLDEILVDHAHCEKKAAGAAMKLLFAYPHHHFMLIPLAELAREELEHFQVVLGLLDELEIPYKAQTPSPYGGRLHALVRRDEPQRAIDVLLVAALIEARSCERFKLLAGAAPDARVATLFERLLASEARHHGVYVELARALGSTGEVDARLAELARAEAEILAEPASSYRLHT
jgi:tRNA-(ms[2]io[6]A)-hydroxylase